LGIHARGACGTHIHLADKMQRAILSSLLTQGACAAFVQAVTQWAFRLGEVSRGTSWVGGPT